MSDIFISYSQKDRAIAASLGERQQSAGYEVWWDTELVGGETYREAIHKQLDQAKAVIVIWSPNAVASRFVVDEADVAAATGKLVSALTEQFSAGSVPLGFRSFQAVQLSDQAALIKALNRLSVAVPASGQVATAIAGASESDPASQEQTDLREEVAWQFVLKRRNRRLIDDFLKEFPNGKHADEARKRWYLVETFNGALYWGLPALLVVIAASIWSMWDEEPLLSLGYLLIGGGPILALIVGGFYRMRADAHRAMKSQENKFRQ